MATITVLGAGLAGLSCSYHIGHENCILFERNGYAGGHIYSHYRDGWTWDEGPHVSFTNHRYVRDLFEQSVGGELREYPVSVSNYYNGDWIPHPAQSNLYAVPEPLRSACLDDFLRTRGEGFKDSSPANYSEWLRLAFGETFASHFPDVYTRKYWTCDPKELAIDWVGNRVYYPDVETVINGFRGPAPTETHYIRKVRYPTRGGYMTFATLLRAGANIRFNHEVEKIDLKDRVIAFSNGKKHHFERLISTIPLPELIRLTRDVPADVRDAAESLRCSSLLLVNVTANHPARRPHHWLYVYDDDKLCTRISHIDLLSPNNTPPGKTGLQVEIYSSPYRRFTESNHEVASSVIRELEEMDLVVKADALWTNIVPYANVIFDRFRRSAQDRVLQWLETCGLNREEDDLEPMTDWTERPTDPKGKLILAGRFGQWKYYWTDDCVLRGREIAQTVKRDCA